jgi:NB-ARC domain
VHSFVRTLRWRARHAAVPLLLPGLVCLAAAIVGQALNVSGVNVPVLHAGSARWFVGLLVAVLVGLSLVVGVEPPPRAGGVRGAWPKLPPNHVLRPELLGRLRAALLDGTGGGPRLVGVWGMAGSGKSVLAAALEQDPAVRRRFPDGRAWVRLEPPAGDLAARRDVLAQRQQGLAAKLAPAGQVKGEVTDVEQGRDRLAGLLHGRACLLVVDNVWTADDVHAFSVLDRRGALLVTTRVAGLVRAAGAAGVEVAELSDAQARTLAAGWAGVSEQLLPPPAADALRLVGNLALGVATVAALARVTGSGGPSWPTGCARRSWPRSRSGFRGIRTRPCWPRCN